MILLDTRSTNYSTRNQQSRTSRPRGDREESFEVILRRFFRDVQQSGILSETKRRRFHRKDISRDKRREGARRKAEIRRIKRGY